MDTPMSFCNIIPESEQMMFVYSLVKFLAVLISKIALT
jgi:hypothetical protein